ncbi:MAG: protein kinase [Planctomycetes bacterium]|nr:protein kinase [Planctomycetota bacterium]
MVAPEAVGAGAENEAPWTSRYEIRETLGEGGAAVVYRARGRELGRPVALMVLGESMSVSESLRYRFRREAQVMATIPHPNVVAVYDARENDSRMYLATELVEGRSPAKMLVEAHGGGVRIENGSRW